MTARASRQIISGIRSSVTRLQAQSFLWSAEVTQLMAMALFREA
jgi:hypothetical protein